MRDGEYRPRGPPATGLLLGGWCDACYQPVPSQDPACGSQRPSGDQQLWSRELGRELLDGFTFQSVTLFLTLANALVIGFETDRPELPCWYYVENAFLFIFTAELAVRLVITGPKAFFCGEDDQGEEALGGNVDVQRTARRTPMTGKNSDVTWNIFDTLLISMGISSMVIETLVSEERSFTKDATLFRAVRLLRLLRVLRMIRVIRFLKQLYLLAYGVMEGAMAVFWVATLASCSIYICSIVLVKFYGRVEEGDPHEEFFNSRFGSVCGAMYTLFSILSSPNLEVFREVAFDNPPLLLFLVVFVLFGSFGMNGLLTGVISESIMDKNQARIESQRADREAKRKLLEAHSEKLFEDMDDQRRGYLTKQDLACHKDKIDNLFNVAGVAFPCYDFDQMFEVMDCDDSGSVDQTEFVHGILELCDEIRPMSIMELHSQVSRCKVRIGRCNSKVEDVASSMENLAALRRSDAERACDLAALARSLAQDEQQQPGESKASDTDGGPSRQAATATLGVLADQLAEDTFNEVQITDEWIRQVSEAKHEMGSLNKDLFQARRRRRRSKTAPALQPMKGDIPAARAACRYREPKQHKSAVLVQEADVHLRALSRVYSSLAQRPPQGGWPDDASQHLERLSEALTGLSRANTEALLEERLSPGRQCSGSSPGRRERRANAGQVSYDLGPGNASTWQSESQVSYDLGPGNASTWQSESQATDLGRRSPPSCWQSEGLPEAANGLEASSPGRRCRELQAAAAKLKPVPLSCCRSAEMGEAAGEIHIERQAAGRPPCVGPKASHGGRLRTCLGLECAATLAAAAAVADTGEGARSCRF